MVYMERTICLEIYLDTPIELLDDVCHMESQFSIVSVLKGPNMARAGVNSLFKNSTKTLEQEVSKKQSEAFCSSSKGVFASHLSNNSS